MRFSKKGILILAAFIIATLGIFIWKKSHSPPLELVYEGKTLSQWVVLLDSNTDHQAQNEAAERALRAMGPKAVPDLIRILQKRPDSPPMAKVKVLAMRLGLRRPPEIQLAEFQYRAARACCVLAESSGVDIRTAIPDLAYSLTNNVFRTLEPFAWALVYSGPEGLAVITNAMAADPSPQVREAAAHSLWISRKIRTPEITGALVAATQDSDANVRVMALLTLQSFAKEKDLANIIAPGVLPCLQDTNAQVRQWTVDLLGRFRSLPEVQVALTNMLNDPDPTVRSQAEKLFERSAGGVEK